MSDKRVLLVIPPFYRLMGSHYNGINLGLSYISAVLNKNGYECSIYNADYVDSDIYSDQIGLMDGYEEYKRIVSDNHHLIWQQCVKDILDYCPDFVGFSVFTANFPIVSLLAGLLKKRDPDIQVLAGGPHVTLARDLVLKEAPAVDFAICGEGEYAVLALMQGKVFTDIDGLIYRNNANVIVNKERTYLKNLDELPYPDRINFYPDTQKLKKHFVITSRGCPNSCSFCASPILWKRKVRFRGTDNVLGEMRDLKNQGMDFIQFQDDTFTFRKKRLMTLLDKMIEERMDFSWICDTRLNCIDADVLKKMKEAGCIRVKIGIESGNREILSRINKGITPELVLDKVKLIRKYGISITAYYMIGFPGETDVQAMETINLAKEVKADYNSLSVVAPYYGTEIFEDFLSENHNETIKNNWEYFFHQSKDMILSKKISKEVIEEFFSLNYLSTGERI